MPWDDIWPPDDVWPLDDRWGYTTVEEFPSGGRWQESYSLRYDLDAASPQAQAARQRDRWAIFVRDAKRHVVASATTFRNAQGLAQHNGVGAFTLDVPRFSDAGEKLLLPQAGVVFMRNGKVVLSGPVRDIEDNFSQSDGSWLTVSGPDDWTHLSDHPALPAPGAPPNTANNFSVQAYDERTGPASGLIGQYLGVNITNPPAARANRRVVGLTYADPGLGSSVTVRGRWQRLGRLCRQICNLSDPQLGIRLRQSADRDEIVVTVFEPVDRTQNPNRVVFSVALGNVTAFTYKRTAGPNYFYGASSGNGTSRIIREGGTPSNITQDGLIELFVAHSDLDLPDQLDAQLKTDAQELGTQWSLSAELKETGTFRWGDDFDLGDLVVVDVRGQELIEKIQQVEFTLDEKQATVTPRIGTNGARLNPRARRLEQIVREHESRLSDLERV